MQKRFDVGKAKISVFNTGDLALRPSEILSVPESEWRPLYGDAFDEPHLEPCQGFHIEVSGASIVVDPNEYDVSSPPGSPYRPANYSPPWRLVPQLRDAGISPEAVTHVIITHAHLDHYSGTTFVDREGHHVPTFPRARYYLGRGDWDDPQIQAGLQDPSSTSWGTLGVLHRLGLLELIEGRSELLQGVSIIPAPGETPGHQMVRIGSSGGVLYCLGDLYHFEAEVEHPDWVATWADKRQSSATRKTVAEVASAEDALLAAAHMSVGRLKRTSSGFTWAEA